MSTIYIKRKENNIPSEIIISNNLGKDILSKTDKITGKLFYLTDDNIYAKYSQTILKDKCVIHFPAGEANKTLSTVEQIERELIDYGANRESFIIGFGGGIVTDIAGFTASTFMRGIKFGFIPTTLLAMVDASIGGKNGVNLDGYKNMVGIFRQPEWVIIDTSLLETLPKREYNAGMAEVLKYSLIYDKEMFNKLYMGNYNVTELIARSAEIKAEIVGQDELESGLRRVLNFGHTMAHAIEKCSKGRYLHGEAVAMGIRYASLMSLNMNLIEEKDAERIDKVIESLELPPSPEGLDLKDIYDAMKHDKKSTGKDGLINEILLDGIGNYKFIVLDLNKLD